MATVRPIAGTRPRGADEAEDERLAAELLADEKERAEHVMLVDLGRNDLGRVCDYGTVRVPNMMYVERYSHVMHIVSQVQGKIRGGMNAFDLLRATFPAGTLSGAPKVRAMEIIEELEGTRRGPYGGAVGYFSFDGSMDTCITIRTMIKRGDTVYFQAGRGDRGRQRSGARIRRDGEQSARRRRRRDQGRRGVGVGEGMAMKQRLLTGDRPTGKLHLGHYVGTIKNRVLHQNDYESFFLVADLHMLTTKNPPEHIAEIDANARQMVLDAIAAGIDPHTVTFYLQSGVHEIHEMYTLLQNLVTVARLERLPSLKDMARDAHIEMPYGLLGYPVLQAADILCVRRTMSRSAKTISPTSKSRARSHGASMPSTATCFRSLKVKSGMSLRWSAPMVRRR